MVGWLHIAVFIAIFADCIFLTGRLHTLLPFRSSAQFAGYASLALLAASTIVLALLTQRFVAALVAVLIAIACVCPILVWNSHDPGPFSINGVGAYFAAISVPLLPRIIEEGAVSRVFRWAFILSLIYAALYVGLTWLDASGPARSGTTASTQAGIKIAVAYVSFGFSYSLALIGKGSSRERIIGLIAAIVFGIAFYASGERTIAVITVVVTTLYLVLRRAEPGIAIAAAMLVGATIVYVYSLLYPANNPFALFLYDNTGRVRYVSFENIQRLLPRSWLWGVGVPSRGTISEYVSNAEFFATDLGTAGILFQFGAIGLCGYLLVSTLAALLPKPLKELRVGAVTSDSLCVTSSILIAYSTISPQFWGEGGTFFTSIFLGVWIAALLRRQRSYS